jgi:hypothetical protein
MKCKALLPFILCLVLLVSCGKKTTDQNSGKKLANITPKQMIAILKDQTFECESINGGVCPEGVARVFVVDENNPTQTGLCSGFLASSNRLVTNQHCISDANDCNRTHIAIYGGGSYEVAQCKTLLAVENDSEELYNKATDYAVIELDRHIFSVQPLRSARPRPSLSEELSAWVIDHLNLYTARITELKCKLKKFGPSIELSTCAAISGNSGSPVLNSNGEFVGVLWGSNTEDYINEETPLDERRLLEVESYVTDLKYFRKFL